MSLKISASAKKAILIGSTCSVSYLAVYVARNILSAATPQMTESGVFTTEGIGSLSSVYFITYAVGQLINGAIGDKIKAKYMIGFGLILAGVCNLAFSLSASSMTLAYIAYALTGFFLSMIYGPMSKVVAENVEPVYATRCSLGYTFASFFGTPAAGLLATFLSWQGVFGASSGMLIVMGCISFAVLMLFERRGIISYGQYKAEKAKGGSIGVLIRHRIIKFTLISVITGVVRTTVVFWLPTYISQHLGFSAKLSSTIFTVATFVISMTAFIAVFIYERLNRNMDLTVLLGFCVSAACFMLVFLIKQPMINIIFMVLAIMASNSAACMLWSRYCPSLRDTGMVSGATGFLDFMSYVAAAISSTLFANAVSDIGWDWLIIIWFGLMVLGIIVALPYKKKKG
ncbi:MAG: MFS transporter [Clostridia bacterium]|nr:MFS transporter [Clostridia bacterium]